jgi:hypothetical protein
MLILGVMAPINMRGWLADDLLPPYDFGGYVSVVEYVHDAVLRYGNVPAWSSKWFAGSAQFTSTFKELATFPLAVWLGPLWGTQMMICLMKVLAGMAMYAVFVRFFRSPTAGIVAGYAYAFSTPANCDTSIHLHVSLSYVLFPLIFVTCVELLRRRRGIWAGGLGVLTACQFSNNSALVGVCLAMGLFLLVLRPWRQRPSEDNPFADVRLGLRWCALLGAALGVFVLFAGSQLAWLGADLANHALHDPEQVAQGIEVYIEHSPFAYFNRGNWLGPWLARHHPPNMPLFADDPIRAQRHYLGGTAMIVCAVGWLLARRHFSLRRSFCFNTGSRPARGPCCGRSREPSIGPTQWTALYTPH